MNMKKLEINEENYDMYQEFLDAKNGSMSENRLYLYITGITIAVFVFFGLGMTGTVLIIEPISNLVTVTVSEAVRHLLMVTGVAIAGLGTTIGATIFSVYKFLHSGIPRILLKSFSRKYPDFDLSLSEEEVKKELEKYEQLSQIPKDIEEKKKEHLTNHQESFREMTTEEKLTFLEKEKEFWQQVAIQEKYRDTEEDTTGQTEIGQIKSPTENGEKVYHI